MQFLTDNTSVMGKTDYKAAHNINADAVIEQLKKIDFTSSEMKKMIDKLDEATKKLREATKVDSDKLNIRFDV